MNLRPYYPVLQKTTLMHGFTDAELDALLPVLAPRTRRFAKGEILLLAGYGTHNAGIVLEGAISAQKETGEGETVLISRMGAGGVFGDILFASTQKSPVTVRAEAETLALFLPFDRILCAGVALSPCHAALIRSLFAATSQKYFALNRRLELLACKTLRGRILLWLQQEAEQAGIRSVRPSLTRAELAAALNCDRSALCRELSKMQREGLLVLHGRQIELTEK